MGDIASMEPADRGRPFNLGLCLSGGGLRATFFHLGTVRALRDLGLLSRVTQITSVSGGSILAAHIVLNWDRYTGSEATFTAAASELLSFAAGDVRGRIMRRWLLALAIPLAWPRAGYLQTALLQRAYDRLYGGATLRQLNKHPGAPNLHILSTSFTTGELCSFSNEGFFTYRAGKLHPFGAELLPVALAVAASSAFPPVFPPVRLTRRMLHATAESYPYDPDYLSDGGVFDNLGIEQLAISNADARSKVDVAIISDAGVRFDWKVRSRFGWIVSRTVRATDILMRRVAETTVRGAASPEVLGVPLVHCRISDELNDTARTDLLPVDLQKRIARIRTDFDTFSAAESAFLIQHGYEVGAAGIRQNARRFAGWSAPGTSATWPALPEQPGRLRAIVSALERSSSRRLGIFSIRDWASWALVAWVLLIVLAVATPYLLQGNTIAAQSQQIGTQQAVIEVQTDTIGVQQVTIDRQETDLTGLRTDLAVRQLEVDTLQTTINTQAATITQQQVNLNALANERTLLLDRIRQQGFGPALQIDQLPLNELLRTQPDIFRPIAPP